MFRYIKMGEYIELAFLNIIAIVLFVMPLLLSVENVKIQKKAQIETKPAVWSDFKTSDERPRFARMPASEIFDDD